MLKKLRHLFSVNAGRRLTLLRHAARSHQQLGSGVRKVLLRAFQPHAFPYLGIRTPDPLSASSRAFLLVSVTAVL